MKIAIRVDASIHIGSGHVMRCLVLADGLRNNGHEVCFVCLPQTGDLIEYIQSQQFSVIELSRLTTPLTPKHDADYAAWLQRSTQEDVTDFLEHVIEADWVVTDHYFIGSDWQYQIKSALGCKIFAIDDLCRKHHADILLDQTLGRLSSEYTNCSKVLAGSKFSLLKPMFPKLREIGLDKKSLNDPIKILVSMGGIDQPNTTLEILKALSNPPSFLVTVLLSQRAPNYLSVHELCQSYVNIKHIDFVEDMASLMLEHDIAIGAPGTTSWERCCLGIPSIIIPIADNQTEIAMKLVSHGAALQVDIANISNKLEQNIFKLLSGWNDFHQSALSICDGLGIYRVLQAIESQSNLNPPLELTPANVDDIELIYQWQSFPETRQYALNKAIPSWDEHNRWMQNKLKSAVDYFYLITDINNDKLGAVRLDRENTNEYLISIFINPNHYGKRIASSALKLLDTLHPHITIKATVLPENNASQRLFEKAGYQRISDNKFIRKPNLI